ncbi:MAG TPA: DUF1365 domain-containing protein, partial [Hyphomonadaceae bacterium]|nr:DUF1365 domain-containing protein [Hyphomonadaceae bacterium]
SSSHGAAASGGGKMTAPARLWFGRTAHVREQPFRRGFSHAIAMLEIDVDRLEEASRISPLFGVNRAAVIAFDEKDHGDRNTSVSLRAWAEARLAEAGVSLEGGAIRLVTFPRVLGYGFAPISLWFGHGPDGKFRGVIYEVHNTFGETHSYVSAFYPADVRVRSDKEFFVSPFFDVSGQYRFTLRPPTGGDVEDRMELIVENLGPSGRQHTASLKLRAAALTTPTILNWLVRMPISGIGVMAAIYWQALRLWLKGARYHVKPEQRARRTTLARPEEGPAEAQEDLRKRA